MRYDRKVTCVESGPETLDSLHTSLEYELRAWNGVYHLGSSLKSWLHVHCSRTFRAQEDETVAKQDPRVVVARASLSRSTIARGTI